MSWKAGLSRYLPAMRFFACPESPSSVGVRNWYLKNYDELKHLNPNFPLLMRTAENCMPAVTTELEWTTDHLLRFMIQTGKFRNPNGTIAEDRVEAAKAYLATDWDKFYQSRLKHPGFDPEQPSLVKTNPDWKDDFSIRGDMEEYLLMKEAMDEQMSVVQGGPDKEFTRAQNALLMAQRVDLWCAGEKEVELAVQHLYKLGRLLNDRETFFPKFITEFYPGAPDL
mmetsp:Transcript_32740/g.79572  ORF Transcript_32740/g.79572 Transcript_32740/m.79572 type:complete len:225 (-) Transcript_32740:412-1086(-)